MTDAETLRAAAEVVRGRLQRPNSAEVLAGYADRLEAEDAAELKAAERDQTLGHIAYIEWSTRTCIGETAAHRPETWRAVARAVREAIEAES